MSMDPDGTNRIVKQQIKQWYSEVDEGRNASLVEREPGPSLRSLVSKVSGPVRGLAGRLAWLRRGPLEAPVVAPRTADGTSSR